MPAGLLLVGRLGVCVALALAAVAVACAGGSEDSIRLAFVGDTHGYNIVEEPSLESRDLLAGVRDVLEDADLLLLNHEGTLIEAGDVPAHCRTFEHQSTFASSPAFAERLAPTPRVVASLANNHALDCGAEGLAQTLAAFASVDITTVGAGSDLEEACLPAELSVNGVDVAFLSYLLHDPARVPEDIAASEDGPGVATMAGCDVEAQVRALTSADLLVVSLHAHVADPWAYGAAPEHVSAVRQLLDWGADVVVSHGPHFPQGVLVEGEGLAFLGLGNFMFRPDYTMPPEAHESLLAVIEVDDGSVRETRLYPLKVTEEGLPLLALPPVSQEILEVVDRLSAEYGTGIAAQDGFGVVETSRGSEPAGAE